VIVLEQPTQPLLTANVPVRRGFGEYSSRKQELIAFALMIPFFVIQLNNATPILGMCVKSAIASIPGMAGQYGCMRAS
jgi:hypothetical protein